MSRSIKWNNFKFKFIWRQFKSGIPELDIGGQGQWKSRRLCIVLVQLGSQTTDSFFYKIRTESGQRTENPDRIRKTGRNRTRFSGKSGQNKTRTGQGQYCPPTSANNRIKPRNWSLADSGRQFGPSAVMWSLIQARKISVLSMSRQKIGRKMKFMKLPNARPSMQIRWVISMTHKLWLTTLSF